MLNQNFVSSVDGVTAKFVYAKAPAMVVEQTGSVKLSPGCLLREVRTDIPHHNRDNYKKSPRHKANWQPLSSLRLGYLMLTKAALVPARGRMELGEYNMAKSARVTKYLRAEKKGFK